MSSREDLLASIAKTIRDYRAGEIEERTPEHVDRWVLQFRAGVQARILRELDYVLSRTYFSKEFVAPFLAHQVKNQKLAGSIPCGFWSRTNFLKIQQNGQSQKDMLRLFGDGLKSECKLRLADCGGDGPYVYLDDVLFSGNRVGNDLSAWLAGAAPKKGIVHIVMIATHTLGEYQALKRLRAEARNLGKAIEFKCWRVVSFENRKSYSEVSDVLWPAVLPSDSELEAYLAEEKKYPFVARKPGGELEQKVFSSEEGRQLLERELLMAGVQIRSFSQNPSRALRPLGFSAFGLGFGALIVTFRNCPNNCPLALWWGDPEANASSPLSRWYPLFPRKTYVQNIDLDDTF